MNALNGMAIAISNFAIWDPYSNFWFAVGIAIKMGKFRKPILIYFSFVNSMNFCYFTENCIVFSASKSFNPPARFEKRFLTGAKMEFWVGHFPGWQKCRGVFEVASGPFSGGSFSSGPFVLGLLDPFDIPNAWRSRWPSQEVKATS